VACVTGAASGIGQATAVALADAGARGVVVTDVRPGSLGETVARVEDAGAEAVGLEADAGRVEDWQRCIEAVDARFGRLDILHANAGMGEGEAGWPGVAPERALAIVDVNLGGVVLGTRMALPLMQRGGGGVVVATSSGAGLAPLPYQAVYAATKAGVIHFVKSCAPLAESHGVRVNCVCPGLTDTPMMYEPGGGEIADWIQPVVDAMPLLRPEDIARAVLEIVRDDAQIGQAIPVMG
jgi:NAD(P)-dependent dehydrogenase (short-subunit alcohol dehydrogenase family)